MTYAAKRKQWEQMGLCLSCGGLKLEPEYKTCVRCRERKREQMRAIYAKDKPIPEKPKVMPEIRKDHKCWFCEWRRFEQDRFFCPFVEGTCVKDGTVKIGLEKEDEE